MRICRVIGTVVATAHHPAYDDRKVLLVRPEDASGAPSGSAFVAVDRVQAGPGDRVLVLTEGTGVRQLLGSDAGPIRSIVAGIIDEIETRSAGGIGLGGAATFGAVGALSLRGR